jgi:predicted dienelactone hydrolase
MEMVRRLYAVLRPGPRPIDSRNRRWGQSRSRAIVFALLLSLTVSAIGNTGAVLAIDSLVLVDTACSSEAIDACLYRPEQTYEVGVLPTYTVVDETRGGRQVGLRIRYPIDAPGPLPVVVFSHGGGPKPPGVFGNEEWGVALARAGYAVVHLNHSLNATDRAWACAQVAAGDSCDGETALRVLRPGDAKAAIHALLTFDEEFPRLAGKLDLDRIAVAGHSFGSYTAMTVAGTTVDFGPPTGVVSFADPTPVSFLALSSSGPGHFGFTDESWQEVDRPLMLVSGAGDRTAGEQPADRRAAFDHLPPGDKALVWIDDRAATHDTFNLANPDQPEMVAWVEAAGLAWFDATLRDRRAAWDWLASEALATASNGVASIVVK